jgi:hypothetical protein
MLRLPIDMSIFSGLEKWKSSGGGVPLLFPSLVVCLRLALPGGRLGFAPRRTGRALVALRSSLETALDVLYDFLSRDLGRFCGVLKVLADDVPVITVSLVRLLTSTGHTHSVSSSSQLAFPSQ